VLIKQSNKIRIKDIAKLAGVSAGTVDRVLHNRGQVTEENRLKINKIIEELNYKPNLLARSLASKRSYLIVTLLPEYEQNQGYWEAPIAGIQKGWKEVADFNVKLIPLFFSQNKVESFTQVAEKVLDYKPDAVLLAPVFKEETVQLASMLDQSGIPYIFIDSDIEGVNNLAYLGQHAYQSGFIAARMLQMGLPEQSVIAVIKSSKASNQTANREKGFQAFFELDSLKEKYTFLYADYNEDSEADRKVQLESFFLNHPEIKAVVIFNSRIYEVAGIIERLNLKNIRLLGYDLLSQNADYLRRGTVTFLIAQRPEEQGYLGIMTLFNYLAFRTQVEKVQYVPIDILTRENIDYYINFNKKFN
jgi:Transcriptional regulators